MVCQGSPSDSKVMFSVRVRLLHLSNHLSRCELAENAPIGDAEKWTTSDDLNTSGEGEVGLDEMSREMSLSSTGLHDLCSRSLLHIDHSVI